MIIPEDKIEALKVFGYTEEEARFLYLVAIHSGYFLARQFLGFVGAKRGYRSHSLNQKLISQSHAIERLATRIFAIADAIVWRPFEHVFWASILSSQTRGISTSKPKTKRSPIFATNCISTSSGCQ